MCRRSSYFCDHARSALCRTGVCCNTIHFGDAESMQRADWWLPKELSTLEHIRRWLFIFWKFQKIKNHIFWNNETALILFLWLSLILSLRLFLILFFFAKEPYKPSYKKNQHFFLFRENETALILSVWLFLILSFFARELSRKKKRKLSLKESSLLFFESSLWV